MLKRFNIKYLTYLFFGYLFWHFGSIMINVRPDGWYVGHVNLYGDLMLHLAFINKFLQLNSIFVPSPIFSTLKPNYPPGADFITSLFVQVVGLKLSLHLVTFSTGIFVVHMARKFILTFVKNEVVVLLSLLLFFFNGGFGFIYFIEDFLVSGKNLVSFLGELPREYTNIQEHGYWWINSLLAYFLPQRGFFFAFPLTLFSLKLLYDGFKHNNLKIIILSAIVAGVIPFFQFYGLLVIFLVLLFIAPYSVITAKNRKKVIEYWIIFGSLTGVIALPLINAISDANALKFIRFDPGWTSKENIVFFWFKNLGLFGPTLILAILWLLRFNRRLFLYFLPFLFIFILSNVFVFQPWDFDNSKLLIYWYFASTIVVSYFIYVLLLKDIWLKKAIGVVLIAMMVFSGSLDVFRTFTKVTYHRVFTKHEVEVGNSVRALTSADAVFITSRNHNHPIVSIAGRSTLLGFEGWVWSHGLNYFDRLRDIDAIYRGSPDADGLIAKYKISYISAGPGEYATFSINDNYLKRFPVINLGEGWRIYDVSGVWSNFNR